MANNNNCEIIEYLLYLLSGALILVCLFFGVKEIKDEIEIGDLLIGIATTSVAICAYLIQKVQAKTQKSQAVTQLNQAFNDINKAVMGSRDMYIKNFAKALYSTDTNSINKGECLDDKVEITSLIFIVLNAYEAYYINNEEAFKGNMPLVLQNLFRYSENARKILKHHSYNTGFSGYCEPYIEILEKNEP